MAKPLHEPGVTVDGFRLEELIHQGGMAALWRVSRPGAAMPLLMKVPRIGEGADPAAIVSFEMEQMIMPRLTGPHVPRFRRGRRFFRAALHRDGSDRRRDFAATARRAAAAL